MARYSHPTQWGREPVSPWPDGRFGLLGPDPKTPHLVIEAASPSRWRKQDAAGSSVEVDCVRDIPYLYRLDDLVVP